jgi:peptide-methionine (S)-S-oxide reductase
MGAYRVQGKGGVDVAADKREIATLGGGCFWCVEAVFEGLRGVESVAPGYSGGHVAHPSYEQVCTGRTGHAEVAQIAFDPEVLSYADLLEVFFAVHDPTTKDRQGHDRGSQYRSVVFYHDEAQRATAERVLASLTREPSWEGQSVVTQIVPFEAFYPAEDYHREYFRRNPEQAYCRVVIAPKVAKFRKRFAERAQAVR